MAHASRPAHSSTPDLCQVGSRRISTGGRDWRLNAASAIEFPASPNLPSRRGSALLAWSQIGNGPRLPLAPISQHFSGSFKFMDGTHRWG
jgi:hypothetical protein